MDPLPRPKKKQPFKQVKGNTLYEIKMLESNHTFHRDLGPSTIYGYDGQYVAPYFEVNRNEKVKVEWKNELPLKHFLPVDKTVHGAEEDKPEVRTVVHVHGGVTRADSDGYPDAWYTNGYEVTGPFFTRKVYEYDNPQQATMLWYHDHTVGINRLNVYAGLAGFYIIRDEIEKKAQLPKGNEEVFLMIQDKCFFENGEMYYPPEPTPNPYGVFPCILGEFFGDFIITNGKAYPYLNVEKKKYRFRILNAANARFFELSLDNGQSFEVIGTDQGLLERSVKVKKFLLAPAERIDVIIDFSHSSQRRINLLNSARAPYPSGDEVNEYTRYVMQFRVTSKQISSQFAKEQAVHDAKPLFLQYPYDKWKEEDAVKERALLLSEEKDEYGRPYMLLNKTTWSQPVTEKPKLHSIEIWKFINISEDTHPIHIHLVKFLLLSRQRFDKEQYLATGEVTYTGDKQRPLIYERGWKDVVAANPGEEVRVITKFTPYSGRYVWHCHMLEHEDNEMMRPYDVVPKFRFANPFYFINTVVRTISKVKRVMK